MVTKSSDLCFFSFYRRESRGVSNNILSCFLLFLVLSIKSVFFHYLNTVFSLSLSFMERVSNGGSQKCPKKGSSQFWWAPWFVTFNGNLSLHWVTIIIVASVSWPTGSCGHFKWTLQPRASPSELAPDHAQGFSRFLVPIASTLEDYQAHAFGERLACLFSTSRNWRHKTYRLPSKQLFR